MPFNTFSLSSKRLPAKSWLFLLSSLFFFQKSFGQQTSIYKNIDRKDTVIRGFKPSAGSDRNYRIYAGMAYSIVKYSRTKTPYAASHTIGLNYSLSENSLHPYYQTLFPEVFGNWGVFSKTGYDQIRRANYFGMGNEARRTSDNIRFHWVRSHHQYGALGLTRSFANLHQIDWSLLYDAVQVLDDKDRYISKNRGTIDPAEFNWQYFAGTRLSYSYLRVDNRHLPTRGLAVNSAVGYQANLNRSGHSFARYSTDLEAYFPFSKEISYAFKTGLSTLSGNPDFYMYNIIGGNTTLRGYHKWRFYGKTAFYNQNELRWITAVNRGSVYGHFGVLGLYDLGRVWLPGETSDKLHFGYGGGLILAPLDKVNFTVVYAISNEDRRFHFTATRTF